MARLGVILLCVALLVASCSTAGTGLVIGREPASLSCNLELPARVVRGEHVSLTFRIRNKGATAVRILTWHTPLEGMFSQMFRVTRDGVELPYEGPLAKRGEPTGDDYIKLEPGEAVSEIVDLSAAYALDAPGLYQVAYTAQLLDVIAGSGSVPQPGESLHPLWLDCQAVQFRIVNP